jgi:hypothetical protein
MMARKNWKKVGGAAALVAVIFGVAGVVLALSGSDAPSGPVYPKPQISGITKEWVVKEYVPYLAKKAEYRAATEDGFRAKALRSYWVSAVEGTIRAHNLSGKCPRSVSDLRESRLSPFIPIDRFPGTPLKGEFLRGGDLPIYSRSRRSQGEGEGGASESQPVLILDEAVNVEAAVRDNAEGTVLFGALTGGVKVGVVYVNEFGGAPRTVVWTVDCSDRREGASRPLAERARAWKGLADALNSYVLAFSVFTGRPPASVSELDGTVGIRNAAAWEDPEVGPVLEILSREILKAWERFWTRREPMGTFEAVSEAG